MSRLRSWLVFVCLLSVPGLVLATEQQPSEQLPTSKYPALKVWDVMNANANEKTIEAARAQCDRFADQGSSDELTLAHCAVLEHKLLNGLCKNVDAGEISFDFLGGRDGSTSHNITKQTGRDDPALLCDLNDGVYAYWFMQSSEESCNNVGIAITEHIPVDEPTMLATKEITPRGGFSCRPVRHQHVQQSSFYVQGVFHPGDYCDDPEHHSGMLFDGPVIWFNAEGTECPDTFDETFE